LSYSFDQGLNIGREEAAGGSIDRVESPGQDRSNRVDHGLDSRLRIVAVRDRAAADPGCGSRGGVMA